MPDSERARRTLPGATQNFLGKALHVDLQRLASSIDDLAQQIEEGRKLMDQMFKTLRADIEGLSAKLDDNASKADLAGLSAQLQAAASKSDVDSASRKLKVDVDTINKKIDILLQDRGNTPQPN